jgi:hypothetical protein
MDILDPPMVPVYLVSAMDFQILVTQRQVHALIVATILLEDFVSSVNQVLMVNHSSRFLVNSVLALVPVNQGNFLLIAALV